MMDFRKLAFAGLVSLGLAASGSAGCSSSSSTGTGGSTGNGGSHTGGSTGTAGNGGAAGATVGCAASDAPASADIATFSSADSGISPLFGTFTYGDTPKPLFTIGTGTVNVTDTVQISAKAHYQGFGIYFNGNLAGTDCLDGHTYTGVQFDLSGSLTGAGCTSQFSILDSEHADITLSTDPKSGGPAGSYAPQLQITSAQLTTTPTLIKVPYTTPAGGSPLSAVDTTKLTGVQWQLSVPVASDGGATECVWNITLANVKFY
jgi:hypothetical protein